MKTKYEPFGVTRPTFGLPSCARTWDRHAKEIWNPPSPLLNYFKTWNGLLAHQLTHFLGDPTFSWDLRVPPLVLSK